ncbi:MAG TPA: aminotransferase class IV, partial [Acidobacteriota bacterium]
TRTDSSDVFLFHKTTRRPVHNRAFELARQQGYFDVLFYNERDELTEGAISNVFSVKNGMYFTPPVSCGLLAGTFRRHLLETKPFPIEERILHKTDIEQAEAIYLTNAVRGLVRCFLER